MTLLRNLRNRHPAAGRAPAPVASTEAVERPDAPEAPEEPANRRRPPRPTPALSRPDLQGPILTPLLDGSDRVPERVRETNNSDGAVHVHGLLHNCARSMQLARQSPIPLYQGRPTGGHRVMWLIGRAVEAHIRNTFIDAVNGENVIGNWTCPCKRTEVYAESRPEHLCDTCQRPVNQYKELVLADVDLGIRGSPDLMLARSLGELVVEIKSMKADGADGFNALEEPVAVHVEQAAIYRKLRQRAGRTVLPYVVVIYCTKDFMFGSPYKEYLVDVSEGTFWDGAVNHHFEQARLINSRTLCPRLSKCSALNKPGPRACPTAVDCFSRAT